MSARLTLLAAVAAIGLMGAAQAETIAITHAKIITLGSAGDIDNGTIVVKDGRIAAAGANVAVPAGARTIDAEGHMVTPGIVASDTGLGAVEVEADADREDFAGGAEAGEPVSAALDVSLGINPASMLIPVARMGGVTRAVIVPQPGRGEKDKLFAGQAAVMDMSGTANSLTKRYAALVVDVGGGAAGPSGGSNGVALQRLEADLEEAASYGANKGGYEHGTHRPYRLGKEDLDALQLVLQGKEPLLVGVHRAADIRRVIELGKRLKLKVILNGAEEGWLVAGDIAAAGYPVLLDPQTDLPNQFESLNSRMENAGLLANAGVTLVVVPPHAGPYARQVRYNAGYGVAHGLPWSAGLAAITKNPAQVFGFAEKTGRIEAGLEGDLVVWSGDPLEMLSVPLHVLVKGVEEPMTSRGQELAKRYSVIDPNQPPAYRH